MLALEQARRAHPPPLRTIHAASASHDTLHTGSKSTSEDGNLRHTRRCQFALQDLRSTFTLTRARA